MAGRAGSGIDIAIVGPANEALSCFPGCYLWRRPLGGNVNGGDRSQRDGGGVRELILFDKTHLVHTARKGRFRAARRKTIGGF